MVNSVYWNIGNLLFDNPNCRNDIWNDGYMVELNFEAEEIEFKLHPYTQCNEEPTIRLMTENQKNQFERSIEELNRTIASPVEINKALDVLSSFTPWTNRLLLAAFVRGLLPSFLSAKRILNIKNRISCESHYDLTIRELKRK